MRDRVRRLLARLTVLALLLIGGYFVVAPPGRADAAAPCNCYNEEHERMGIWRNGYCDPVC